MRKVFILGACRTPIGKMGGSLASLSAVDLGSIVIKESLKRSGVLAEAVDHVFMGCVIQAGLGQNVARQAALKAGLPSSTTAISYRSEPMRNRLPLTDDHADTGEDISMSSEFLPGLLLSGPSRS